MQPLRSVRLGPKKFTAQQSDGAPLVHLYEIGIWVMAEAGALDADVAFLAETASEFVPSRAIDAAQVIRLSRSPSVS